VAAILAMQSAWLQTHWVELAGGGLLLLCLWAVLAYRTRQHRRDRERLEEAVGARSAELAKANRELQEVSLKDPLTGVRNRRFFQTTIAADASQAVRAYSVASKNYSHDHRDLVFYLVDIDHFKPVNDQHGHDVGDLLLIAIAQRLDEVVRKSDFLIRWGGEEFLIVCRSAERLESHRMAERILNAVGKAAFNLGSGRIIQCTCSVGWAPFPWVPPFVAEASVEEVLRLADRGLYLAKQGGRNQSVGILPGDGELPTDEKKHLRLETLAEKGLLQEVRTAGPIADTADKHR
jgi:diguanylate cyclase (GGDEF)-like protein